MKEEPANPEASSGCHQRPLNLDARRLSLTGGTLLPAGTNEEVIPIRVVRAGRTNPIRGFPRGLAISAASLQDGLARGLFDGVAVFFMHVLESGRDVRDLAGVTDNARWDEEAQAVIADVHAYHNTAGKEFAALAGDFRRHRERGIARPDVGVSMDSYFTTAPPPTNNQPPATAVMTALSSIDVVFRPAADGRILATSGERLPAASTEAAAGAAPGFLDQGSAHSSERLTVQPQKGGNPMSQEIETQDESARTEPEAAGAENAQAPTIARSVVAQAATLPEQEEETDPQSPDPHFSNWLSALRESTVQARLAASDLPQVVRARLAAGGYRTPADLDAAIEAARAELAALAEENVIQIGNVPPRSGRSLTAARMQTGLEQLAGAVDWIFGVREAGLPEPSLRDVRTLYHTLTGDFEFHGMFRPERVVLTGATTTTLADLAANAMNKVIVQQFARLTNWRWYEFVAYATPNDGSVQDMQWTVLGGIENLPVVPEKGAYGELDLADVAETDSFTKYGGYVPITLELIRNSDIQRLQAVPRNLATAAVRTRSAQVSAIFTANSGTGPTLDQDSTALFHANHSNLVTTAFGTDETAWKAAAQEMFQQTEVNSGKPLAFFPKYGLFPVDLYHTALSVFGYGDGLPQSYEVFSQERGLDDPRPVPLVVPDWTDATDWAYIADPAIYPVIHISYAQAPGGGSHPAPELYTVASPTAGLMFSNDVMPIKIRDWFAVGVNGYRGIGKRNVA